MTKRTLALAMSTGMLLSNSVWAADTDADPYGAMPETVTLHVGRSEDANASYLSGQDSLNNYLVDYIKEQLNVVILINYPKDIKAFYMKQNDDGKTVRAMDVLFPGIGEIIGGSEREADYGKLHARVQELGMNEKELWWYLDTRRWGSAPHSGFGLGFDRLLLFVTGMTNIRDVQPFPRTPKNAEF